MSRPLRYAYKVIHHSWIGEVAGVNRFASRGEILVVSQNVNDWRRQIVKEGLHPSVGD